ncbi:hypothetical protein AB0I54_31865 [Streptomyces sp. NPDC050625]|uniref:hypothetical protein n=1 Tax=Streptomyces sp. NPDC050625 TaxID=3154629 RepID=UPI0034388D66
MAQPSAVATAPSTLTEQSITASLTAEIMTDLDNGQPTLVASTQGNQGDVQVVTPAQLLAKVNQARAQLDRIEALANEYAAASVIPAFIKHYGIELIESSLDGLAEIDPDLAAGFKAFAALKKDNTFTVVVPKGQAPVERLAAIRGLVLDLVVKAEQA